jgi:DHA1 family multidrug resistance protein-like MFS transporter
MVVNIKKCRFNLGGFHKMHFSLPYMPHWKRNLYLVSLGVFIAQIGFSTVTPFLSTFVKQLGLTTNISIWSGLIFSISSLTAGIMSPIWGSISDRHGKKPMMARAGIGMGIAYFLMSRAQNHLQLFALRGINGLVSGYTPAAITLIAANSRPEDLNYSMGIVQAASATGTIMGPLVGGISAKLFGIRGSIVFTSVLLFVAAILPYAAHIDEEVSSKSDTTILKDMAKAFQNRQLVILLGVWLLIQAALQTVFPTLALFIGELEPENAELYTGIVLSIMGISTALGAPLVSQFKIHTNIIFKWSILLCAVFTALQGFSTTVLMLGFVRFLFGFVNSSVTVSGNILIAQNSDQNSQGSTFGILNGVMSIGLVLGPILGGFLGDHYGLSAPFSGGAVIFMLACILSSFIIDTEQTTEKL